MKLYQEIMIWKRLNQKSAARYTCLHDLKNKKYIVQSRDCFHLPFDKAQADYHERQFIELFIEESTSESEWFDSLEDAINAHDEDFQ
ncbi:hypothetical protein [Aquirhabdus sp.]|uniref:hypothetical protein n=1 Tax=Aquirhabdus sp. TaxID=2824160 RepID=UPI00396D04CB